MCPTGSRTSTTNKKDRDFRDFYPCSLSFLLANTILFHTKSNNTLSYVQVIYLINPSVRDRNNEHVLISRIFK